MLARENLRKLLREGRVAVAPSPTAIQYIVSTLRFPGEDTIMMLSSSSKRTQHAHAAEGVE